MIVNAKYLALVTLSVGLHLYVLRWGFEYAPVVLIILLPVFYADFVAERSELVSILKPSRSVSFTEEPVYHKEEVDEDDDDDDVYSDMLQLDQALSQMQSIARTNESASESTRATGTKDD
jgi:hypothetical protein